ncbi:hypothetical protein KIH39_03115 [Telmatocola sphagniphila]|uniref:Uncharacterized protein n=1 Tax=Telmatocola sphagniphila TaxID=1123043 RepID=A0A8E6B6R0_9BACT|nr:hypothetical protein [Telmatocola sphagniphila]QVL32922.1 hypothetical protein KIH39_03115 [Telmatocola sphagniphila]
MSRLLVIGIVLFAPCLLTAEERPPIRTITGPSASRDQGAGLIGGGRLFKGDPAAQPADGTFGWDYVGKGQFMHRIFLGWNHDRKQQFHSGGTYNTEGTTLKKN